MKIKYYVSNLWDEVNAIFRKSFTALHTLIRNKKGWNQWAKHLP